MVIESFLYSFSQRIHIYCLITGTIRYFESSSKIDHFQFFEMWYQLKQHFYTFYKHICIFYITACMNLKIADMNVISFYEFFNFIKLVDGDTKLTAIMAR